MVDNRPNFQCSRVMFFSISRVSGAPSVNRLWRRRAWLARSAGGSNFGWQQTSVGDKLELFFLLRLGSKLAFVVLHPLVRWACLGTAASLRPLHPFAKRKFFKKIIEPLLRLCSYLAEFLNPRMGGPPTGGVYTGLKVCPTCRNKIDV